MENKYVMPFTIAGLTAAFAIISFLVYITKGNNAYFLKKKLRIGALLLSLTAVTTGCNDNVVTCYAPLPGEEITLNSGSPAGSHGELVLNLSKTDTVQGTIFRRYSSKYSFQLATVRDSILQRENISALDGAFDEPTESFNITLRRDLDTGYYHLKIFDAGIDSISEHTLTHGYTLQIVNPDSL